MTQWQQPQYQPRQQRPLEVRGTGRTVTWDGRTLTIRARVGGDVVAIPVRQVSAVTVKPLDLSFTVTTTDGRARVVRYWPGRGGEFRALRDAVLGAVAAMG
jgi:hypothetical protein